ncbi:glycosyltransferase family 4 protein, partial [Caminibacter sp.]
KIAITLNTSWNIYNFRLGLLKALQKEGYEIVCVAPRDEYSKKLEELGFEYREIKINNKGTNPVEELKLIFDFYRLYKDIKPDVLLHYTIKPNIYGSIAAGMLKIPVISNISGLGTVFLNNSLSSKIARKLYKIGLKFPKKVFFQNPHDRELFIKNRLVNPKKTDLLPGSGIDTEKFKPSKIRKNDGKVKFLMVARLVGDKGVNEYIKAAEKLKQDNVEFALLGAFYPGNPTALSKEEIQKWHNEGVINYLGVSDDVKSIMEEYDVIVLPSYREGLSRVLLEAASLAKPIVTTNVPGCKDVVDDGVNGFLCEVKNASSLAEAMKKMIDLPYERRIEMGKKGREKILREFDERIVIEKYMSEIKNLL